MKCVWFYGYCIYKQSPSHTIGTTFLPPLPWKDTASLGHDYILVSLWVTLSALFTSHSEIVKKVLLGSCTDPNMALQFCYKALMLMELYTSQNGRHWWFCCSQTTCNILSTSIKIYLYVYIILLHVPLICFNLSHWKDFLPMWKVQYAKSKTKAALPLHSTIKICYRTGTAIDFLGMYSRLVSPWL